MCKFEDIEYYQFYVNAALSDVSHRVTPIDLNCVLTHVISYKDDIQQQQQQ